MLERGAGRGLVERVLLARGLAGRLVPKVGFRLWCAVHAVFFRFCFWFSLDCRALNCRAPHRPTVGSKGMGHRPNTDEFVPHDGHPLLRQIYLDTQEYLAHKNQRPL